MSNRSVHQGVDRKKALGQCMVVGCKGKPLYKGHTKGTLRGYCADHKAFAVSPLAESNLRFWGWQEERDR